MTSNNDGSDLSETPTRLTTPFSIAARSAVSSKLANHTRHAKDRRGIISPKRSKELVVQTNSPWSRTVQVFGLNQGPVVRLKLDWFRPLDGRFGPSGALMSADRMRWMMLQQIGFRLHRSPLDFNTSDFRL